VSDDLSSDEPGWSADQLEPRRLGPQVLAVIVLLAVLFGGGFALVRWGINGGSSSSGGKSSSTAPAPPKDAASSVLPTVILQPGDVGPTYSVRALVRGDQVRGQTTATLDLCNGKFPSEGRRTARLQDALLDAQANELLSTEAVLYTNSSATAQAFSELRSVAASCPSKPVASPVGEPTVTTKFNPAPDANWTQTPTVERQAYSFTTTDQTGKSFPGLAVYLRRGRALMGIYFAQPDMAQPAVAGQTSIQGIVTLFASRLAQLPASVVGQP
jgi:hypothetical protein